MQVYPNRFNLTDTSNLKPFYLIFGEEPQQKLECLEQLRKAALAQGFDERQSLVADNQFSWDTLIEATQTLSLFSSRQIIELEIPTGKPGAEGSKVLTSLTVNINPDVLLVIHGGKIDKGVQNTKWFKAIDKHGVYVPSYPLEGNALHQWIGKKMHDSGLQASPQVSQLLVECCEGNLLAATQEIEKLKLLYPNGAPTFEQVSDAVVDQSRFTVFHLVDVLLSGDPKKTIKMLYRLESEGVEPTIVAWALTREWQTLQSILFDKQQGKNINWNQYRIWKSRQSLYQSAMQRLSLNHMALLQTKLAAFDVAIKQTQVVRPYIELCHLCMMFMPYSLENLPLDYGIE
ncbi:DNA polymerase III subunit delta [Paraglaciecola marina]|uniref:DNA polymerase III subunit delta n=1 Tax=Paraglaciecola marina TaxID=2500157 RepID=UPI0010622B17|nr:DNA polymerase III subunit delta [Paraglaciecola marina]